MARIAGVNIPTKKRVPIGADLHPRHRPHQGAGDLRPRSASRSSAGCSELTDDEVLRIRELIDRDYTVEGDLRREVAMNIKRLMDLGCYRGLRHRKGLPVRGQRTHTNARTRKGQARPIAGKKKDASRRQRNSGRATWRRPRSAASAPARAQEHHLRRRPCERQFNNTMITITDAQGNTIAWSSSGSQGFKGSRKSTPYAAQVAAEDAGRRRWSTACARSRSRSRARARAANRRCARCRRSGFTITSIRDVTPIPHNGCRPPKRRRV